MMDSFGWLAICLICAVIGGAVGVAAVDRRARASGQPRPDRK